MTLRSNARAVVMAAAAVTVWMASAAPLAALPADTSSVAASPDTAWVTLHIHAVRVSDCCAGQRVASVTPAQVTQWVEKANEVYAAARIRFIFDPTPNKGDWADIADTDLNNLAADLPGDPSWERGRAKANELAYHFPRKVLILFRHGPGAAATGGGFSSNRYNFVVMPGYDTTFLCGSTGNPYLLAHEMGHYFGLEHTFVEFKTAAEAQVALKAAKNDPKALDGDGLAETPPEPFIQDMQCGKDPLVILNGIPFPLLRTNVMSYYASDTKTLSPKQIEIVRVWLKRRFAGALDDKGPYMPDERRTYQILSLASGKALEAAAPPASSGATTPQLRLGAWSGAASQGWRFVPLTAQDVGSFEIVSVATGKCLAIANADFNDGGRLVLDDWGGQMHQKWRIVQDDRGDFYLEAMHSRKVLGVARDFVGQANDSGQTLQRWRLLPAD